MMRVSNGMERDNGTVTVAFHGCRSVLGANAVPADAWSSSTASVWRAGSRTTASRRKQHCDALPDSCRVAGRRQRRFESASPDRDPKRHLEGEDAMKALVYHNPGEN